MVIKILKKNINKKIINNYFTILLYMFIIFSSMIPSKETSQNLHNLDAIIPGIHTLYSENSEKENDEDKEYSIKIIEIIQNFL